MALGKDVSHDPQTMLHVIEGDNSAIKHEHGVVQADLVAQTLRQALDEPHHVVGKVADRAGNERRQPRYSHRTEAFHVVAEKRDRIALLPHQAVAAFHDAGTARIAKDLLGMRAGKRVARDFFAALNAFQQEGIARALRNPQVGAYGREQVRGEHIEDGNQVPLLGQALKFAKVRLDHRGLRGLAGSR